MLIPLIGFALFSLSCAEVFEVANEETCEVGGRYKKDENNFIYSCEDVGNGVKIMRMIGCSYLDKFVQSGETYQIMKNKWFGVEFECQVENEHGTIKPTRCLLTSEDRVPIAPGETVQYKRNKCTCHPGWRITCEKMA